MRITKGRARVLFKLFIRLIPGYALFFLSISIVGLLYKNLFGMMLLFIAFVLLRYKYNDSITYHSNTSKKCLALSILIFSISSTPLIAFNSKVTLLLATPIGITVTWLLYQFGLKDSYKKQLLDLSLPKPFDLDNCTEEELRARCKERFTRDVEYKTERAIKHFILKLPHEEIDVNPEQSKKERYRFRKILK